jgi:uncharacterized protein (TIGR03437 family)
MMRICVLLGILTATPLAWSQSDPTYAFFEELLAWPDVQAVNTVYGNITVMVSVDGSLTDQQGNSYKATARLTRYQSFGTSSTVSYTLSGTLTWTILNGDGHGGTCPVTTMASVSAADSGSPFDIAELLPPDLTVTDAVNMAHFMVNTMGHSAGFNYQISDSGCGAIGPAAGFYSDEAGTDPRANIVASVLSSFGINSATRIPFFSNQNTVFSDAALIAESSGEDTGGPLSGTGDGGLIEAYWNGQTTGSFTVQLIDGQTVPVYNLSGPVSSVLGDLAWPGSMTVSWNLSGTAPVVPNGCDINGDGQATVLDVQTEINEALGIAAATNDLNGDGVVNALDIQILVNAILGYGCGASPPAPDGLSAPVRPAVRNSGTYNRMIVSTAQLPTITAVVNAANLQSGPVSPGEIVTVSGAGLGPSMPAGQAGKPAAFGGVQVLFDGTRAPLTYVSATRINCVVPYKVRGERNTHVQVSYQGQTSGLFRLITIAANPALFTANGSGSGPAAALNQDLSYNSPSNPAARGSTVVLLMTGEGQTSPPGVTGKVTTVSAVPPRTPQPVLPVRVLIGGQPATIAFYGEAPGWFPA